MSFDEEEVDEELIDHLKEPIPKKKRTYTETFEEKEDEETEDDEQTIPCSKQTREEIYNLWSQKWDQDGEKLLPIVQKLSTMSEAEAKAYLACLKAMHGRSVHKHLTSRVLSVISHMVCHPHDVTTPLAMQEDEYLITGVSLCVSDVLAALGKLGLLLLLFLYASSSRFTHQERKKPTDNTGKAISITPEPISSHGVLQSRDGENNVNDKVND